jgi:hypothetical protein
MGAPGWRDGRAGVNDSILQVSYYRLRARSAELRMLGWSSKMTPQPVLTIGAVMGGPGVSREWSDAVMQLGRRVIAVHGSIVSPLSVNVVYQVPGRYVQPDFDGVRSGRFSRKEARLLVQAALPLKASSDPDGDVRRLLGQAIELAEDFARQEGMIDGDLRALRELLSCL